MQPDLCPTCKHLVPDCACDEEFADLVEIAPPLKRRKSARLTSIVSHSEEVYNWRKDGFKALGFSRARSEFLAETNVELARARKMHAQGCSLELIDDILLGTCFAGEDENWFERIGHRDEETEAESEHED